MSAAYIHLALNHIPVLGTLLAALLLAYGLWRDHESTQKAALGLLVVVGAAAVAVYWTGEPAEEIVEGMAGVSHDAIEAHEHWGWYAFLASIVTGLASLGALLYGWSRRTLVRWTVQLAFIFSLLTAGTMVYTANLGGKVHHPELRANTTAVETPEEHEENE